MSYYIQAENLMKQAHLLSTSDLIDILQHRGLETYPKEKHTVTAQITYNGDPSVGIFGGSFLVTGLPEMDNEEIREENRKVLSDAFEVIADEPVYVEFSDEPPSEY